MNNKSERDLFRSILHHYYSCQAEINQSLILDSIIYSSESGSRQGPAYSRSYRYFMDRYRAMPFIADPEIVINTVLSSVKNNDEKNTDEKRAGEIKTALDISSAASLDDLIIVESD